MAEFPELRVRPLVALSWARSVCAPGVERSDLLGAVFAADLAAFRGQAPELAKRYTTGA